MRRGVRYKIKAWLQLCALSASRSSVVAPEWGEAGEDGARSGNTAAGAVATGAAAPGAGGGTQPAAAQQRSGSVFTLNWGQTAELTSAAASSEPQRRIYIYLYLYVLQKSTLK